MLHFKISIVININNENTHRRVFFCWLSRRKSHMSKKNPWAELHRGLGGQMCPGLGLLGAWIRGDEQRQTIYCCSDMLNMIYLPISTIFYDFKCLNNLSKFFNTNSGVSGCSHAETVSLLMVGAE